MIASLRNSTAAFQVRESNLFEVRALGGGIVPIGDASITRVGKTHIAINVDGKQILKMRLCDSDFLKEAFKAYIKAANIALKNRQSLSEY
jgi:hypothetical protein